MATIRTNGELDVTFFKNEQVKHQFGNNNEWVDEPNTIGLQDVECRIDIPAWQYRYESKILSTIIIDLGYYVEVDVWYIDNKLYLGHDAPQYEITYDWLKERKKMLWAHCKNIKALELFDETIELHYFWHENDTVTLTSQGTIWGYSGKQPIKNSIAVMPELYNDDVSNCLGICSDFIEKYRLK
jgi:hypothetical protein